MSVTVHVKYGDVEETFSGDTNAVWVELNQFFSQMIPLFDAIQNMILTPDLGKVVEACKGVVAVTEEGPVVLIPKQKLTDNETLLLMLLAAWVSCKLGKTDKDELSGNKLQEWLGKNGKITGTRLGELRRERLVTKTENGEYRLSTLGIKRLVDDILPLIRNKM